MEQSIFYSIKRILGVDPSYTVYDNDILLLINGVFARLHELGIGPVDGFAIEDDAATWGDFLGSDINKFNQVKTYVYLSVRILFDPPQTGYLVTAMEKQIDKLEWTINVVREEGSWINPSLPVV